MFKKMTKWGNCMHTHIHSLWKSPWLILTGVHLCWIQLIGQHLSIKGPHIRSWRKKSGEGGKKVTYAWLLWLTCHLANFPELWRSASLLILAQLCRVTHVQHTQPGAWMLMSSSAGSLSVSSPAKLWQQSRKTRHEWCATRCPTPVAGPDCLQMWRTEKLLLGSVIISFTWTNPMISMMKWDK